MRPRSFILFLSLCCYQFTFAQESFENNLPAGWAVGAGAEVSTDQSRSGGVAIRLGAPNAFLQSDGYQNVSRIEFWASPPDLNDNLTLLVEASTDLINWELKARINYLFEPGDQDVSPTYSSHPIALEELGRVYVRWRIGEYIGGDIYLDDVHFVSLDASQIAARRKEIEDIEEREHIKRVVEEAKNIIAYEDAREAFLDASKQYQERLSVLANVYLESRKVQTIPGTWKGSTSRSDMANPLAYSEFNNLIEGVKPLMTGLKETRFNDVLEDAGNPSMGGFKFLGRAALYTFGGFVLDMVAEALDDDNLDKLFPNRRRRGRGPEYERLIATREETYNRLKVMLDVLSAENAVVSNLYEQAESVDQKFDDLKNDVAAFAGLYLEQGGGEYDATTVNNILIKEEETMHRQRINIEQYLLNVVSNEETFSGQLTTEQRRILENVNNNIAKVDEFVFRYRQNLNDTNGFISAVLETLKDNPFEGLGETGASKEEWNRNRDKTRQNMEAVKNTIEEVYLKQNLYSQEFD